MKHKSFLKIATTDPLPMLCGVSGAALGGIIGMAFGGPVGGVLGGVCGFTCLLAGAAIRHVQLKRDRKAFDSLIKRVDGQCEKEDKAGLSGLLDLVHRSRLSSKVKNEVFAHVKDQLQSQINSNQTEIEAARVSAPARAEGLVAKNKEMQELRKLIDEMQQQKPAKRGIFSRIISALTGRDAPRGQIPRLMAAFDQSRSSAATPPATQPRAATCDPSVLPASLAPWTEVGCSTPRSGVPGSASQTPTGTPRRAATPTP